MTTSRTDGVRRSWGALLAALSLLGAGGAAAATVSIDLAGATTGTLINGVGGSFAQTFAGQTVSGTGITGSPSGPLTLAASGSISVAFFDPNVSPAANSLLPQPNNQAPLSLLLATDADQLTWTMGSASGGSIFVDLFALNGSLVGTTSFSNMQNYAVYSFSGLGTFRGVTFRNNDDEAGLRFMNFSYNSVTGPSPVPEPGTLGLLGLGFAGLLAARRRR